MDTSQIGKRAWSYAGVLQDAGLSTKRKYIGVEVKLFRKIQDAARKAHRSEDSLIQEWLREKVS